MVSTSPRFAILLLALGALIGARPAPATTAHPATADATARPAIAQPSEWVLPAVIPPAPDHVEGASVIDLLTDNQIRLIDGGSASYRNNIYRIVTSQGLDSGALEINWDPSLETLTIHRYRILRDGKTIDLLGDGSRVQVVRREKNLENATLDGELTASQQPEDLRVGDVIDLAFTIVRRDPATGGRAEGLYGPQDGWTYGRYRLRVTWPHSRQVFWRAAPGVVQPKLSESAGQSELLADLTNIVTQHPPARAPARFDMVNLVDVTEFADWRAVSRRFATLFDAAATLAPDSPLRGEIARIAAVTPDPVRRAELALTLAENQVRYLFIGIDDGGFVPAPADQTWQRRYGDCKGKTALLMALLHGLGIEATPVLVNTEDGDGTAHRLPTMAGFDHVIVAATIAGRVYWLDGTREGDTRLDRLAMPNYVVGLPATTTGTDLIAMVPPAPLAPRSVTSLTLDASAGVEVPAAARAEMRFHGEEAATMRMKYTGLSTVDLDRTLKKLWRETYDFITPDTVAAQAEEPSGDFVISLHGRAKMDWALSGSARWYELDRARVGWKFDTTRDNDLVPDAPFVFAHPEWWANHERVILPQHGEGFTLQSKDIDQTVGGIYAFHRKVTLADGVVTMDNDTRSLRAELPASEAEGARTAMADLAGEGVFVHLPDSYLHTAADFQALATDHAALARAHMHNGAVLLDRNDTASAIAEETAALSVDHDLAPAHATLALALARDGKDDKRALAEADALLAAKGTPDAQRALAWSARGNVLLRQGDSDAAMKAFDQVVRTTPGDSEALLGRGVARLRLHQSQDALADFDAVLVIQPTRSIHALRALALIDIGRRDDALDEADRAVEQAPTDRDTRMRRSLIRERSGDIAGALADAEVLLAHDATAMDYLNHADLLPVSDTTRREADIAAALKLDPHNAGAWLLRTQSALATGRLADAAAALAQAETLKADALVVTGMRLDLLARRGQADAALKLAGETTAKHPGDAQALNVVCWFKATRNVALATARADCDAALKIAADAPAYLDSRGLVRLRGDDSKGAMADYSAALRHSPDLVSSLYGRGIAYARLGERNRALADLYHARSIKPEIDTIWADYGVKPPAGY